MGKFDVLILCLAISIVVVIAVSVSKSTDKAPLKPKTAVAMKAKSLAAAKPLASDKQVTKKTKLVKSNNDSVKKDAMVWNIPDENGDVDVPNTAFPSMLSEVGDADAELAQSYTYEKLQDSMLSSDSEQKKELKSRNAWSRLGERANPEIWEAQMEEMKKSIKSSGQTFTEFSENSWAPIPDQLASLWKESESAQPEIKRNVFAAPKASKAGMVEAASLAQDATQEIPVDMAPAETMHVLKEVLAARKRGKALGLTLPQLTSSQSNSLKVLSKNKSLGPMIRTIQSI